MKIIQLLLLVCITIFAQAQDSKELPKRTFQAKRTSESIKIDGKAEEAAWAEATILTDFTQWQGAEVGAPSIAKTEVKVLYSDAAVYIFARSYDKRTDVRKELSERDGIGNADFFGVLLDPFMSEIEAFEFIVTAAGTQFDAKIATFGEDNNWDAVWNSKVVVEEDSWAVEIEIPFSAIRFPSTDVQSWGVNVFRSIQRTKEKSSWNKVDPNINGFVNQAGIMQNIKSINAPLRLSATPFISLGVQTGPDGNQYAYGGGGDIKLGLNNAFTLDLTVIPDFSQTRSDAQVLNISPFEVFYSERRPFFTEGTELFEKGDIIYTRRIGSSPLNGYKAYSTGKKIKKNPTKSQLINAIKVSGRTDKKLGIGFLNAVEARTFTSFEDDTKIETNPLTNYNILVFDQQLKNNSSVAIINSNVFREGHDYDANVTAIDYSLNTKDQKWNTDGVAAISQIILPNEENTIGHKLKLSAGKQSGKLTYDVNYAEVSDTYNPNDFGFQRRNNSREIYIRGNYRERKPKNLRSYNLRLSTGTEYLYDPNEFVEYWINFNGRLTTKKFLSLGIGGFIRPFLGQDFYEPRSPGRFYTTRKVLNIWAFGSTDYNQKFALDIQTSQGATDEDTRRGNVDLGLRYRFSDKLTSRINLDYNWNKRMRSYIWKDNNALGYDALNPSDVILGKRNRNTLISSLSIDYKINTNMTCSFYGRNYWTQLETIDYFLLELDGSLSTTPYKGIDENKVPLHDQTFDFFSIDFVYRWHFSPGSDLYLTWKNFAIGNTDALFSLGETINETFVGDKNNAISLKVLYYLDYNQLKRKKS